MLLRELQDLPDLQKLGSGGTSCKGKLEPNTLVKLIHDNVVDALADAAAAATADAADCCLLPAAATAYCLGLCCVLIAAC